MRRKGYNSNEDPEAQFYIQLHIRVTLILGHPGVPGDPPEYRGFAHFQGGLIAPLGDPKNFKYFFHMVNI